MFATYAIKIDVLHVIKTFLKKNLMPLLRCIVLYWTVTGCVHDIMEEKPYTDFYTPPKTPPKTPPRDLHTLVDKRIGVYKTQIQECKEHLSLTEEVEKLSYKEIKKAYRKFSLKNHPDKEGGDTAIFQKGNGAWDALNNTLGEDEEEEEEEEEGKYKLGEENLKDVKEPLLTYLKSYLKTHIEKNIETYRERPSATPPQ